MMTLTIAVIVRIIKLKNRKKFSIVYNSYFRRVFIVEKCIFCDCEILTDKLGEVQPRNYVKGDQDGKGHYWWCPKVPCHDLNDGSLRFICGERQFYEGVGAKPIPAMCCGKSACQKKRKDFLLGVASDNAMRTSLANNKEERNKAKGKAIPTIEAQKKAGA